jgi:hypothetical protein
LQALNENKIFQTKNSVTIKPSIVVKREQMFIMIFNKYKYLANLFWGLGIFFSFLSEPLRGNDRGVFLFREFQETSLTPSSRNGMYWGEEISQWYISDPSKKLSINGNSVTLSTKGQPLEFGFFLNLPIEDLQDEVYYFASVEVDYECKRGQDFTGILGNNPNVCKLSGKLSCTSRYWKWPHKDMPDASKYRDSMFELSKTIEVSHERGDFNYSSQDFPFKGSDCKEFYVDDVVASQARESTNFLKVIFRGEVRSDFNATRANSLSIGRIRLNLYELF